MTKTEMGDEFMKFDQFLDMAIEELKNHRNKLGLTQEQLAERIGKQQSVIARFESGGVRDPRLSMFFDMCEGLDISPAEIFQKSFGAGLSRVEKSAVTEKSRLIRSKLKQLNKSAKDDLAIIDEVLKLI